MKWGQVKLLAGMIGLSYVLSIFIIIALILVLPVVGWLRAFRLVGLGSNVLGAVLSIIPRALRIDAEIIELATPHWNMNEAQKKALLFDTKIARWGLVLILIGFIQQLFGNLG
jgi:hypothetical protein